jgi:hypothetical protein
VPDLNELPPSDSDKKADSHNGRAPILESSYHTPHQQGSPSMVSKGKANMPREPSDFDRRMQIFLAKHGKAEGSGGSSSNTVDTVRPDLDAKDRQELYYLREGVAARLHRWKKPHVDTQKQELLKLKDRLPNMRNRRTPPQVRKENKRNSDREAAKRSRLRSMLGVAAAPFKKPGLPVVEDEDIPLALKLKRKRAREKTGNKRKMIKMSKADAAAASISGLQDQHAEAHIRTREKR